MQTYSHLIITAALNRPLKRRGYAVHSPAFLLGAVVPDLPFILLTALGEIYYRWMAPVPTGESPMTYMHFTLYFTDPLWISAHNFFHAPLVLLGIGLAGYVGVRQEKKWGTVLVWFALGAGLHSLIDIFTHAGDGPLLLFPINWHIRFNSPVSYWDPRHFGLIFAPLEHLLDLVILFYWAHTWRRQHKAKTAGPEVQG